MCLFEDRENTQRELDILTKVVVPFGMCLASSKCTVPLQDSMLEVPSLILDKEQLTIVDRFICLVNCLTNVGGTVAEVSIRISQTRLA